MWISILRSLQPSHNSVLQFTRNFLNLSQFGALHQNLRDHCWVEARNRLGSLQGARWEKTLRVVCYKILENKNLFLMLNYKSVDAYVNMAGLQLYLFCLGFDCSAN